MASLARAGKKGYDSVLLNETDGGGEAGVRRVRHGPLFAHGIGEWGVEPYTDEGYDPIAWPGECEALEGSTTDGIGWESFEGILYSTHRWGRAQADLEQCKRNA